MHGQLGGTGRRDHLANLAAWAAIAAALVGFWVFVAGAISDQVGLAWPDAAAVQEAGREPAP